MNVFLFATALVHIFNLHWIGDFLLQTRWMAENKSKDWGALAAHVACLTTVLIVGMFALELHMPAFDPFRLGAFVLSNGVLHFATDAITSRITSRAWSKGNAKHFFDTIGFDQFVHMTTYIGTFTWLYGNI